MMLAWMYIFDNWSMISFFYLALHGSYGIVWLIKDFVFPDPNFLRKATISSAINSWLIVLGPYCYFGYLVASRQSPQEISNERMCVAMMVYVIGVVLMMCTDAQKYFTLRENRKLLDDCFIKWSRNTNYVGEIMIYSSFALVIRLWTPWLILGWVWSFLFVSNMLSKDYSLSKKVGWEKYQAQSWMLFFKFGGSTTTSIVIYAFGASLVYGCQHNGGIEATLK